MTQSTAFQSQPCCHNYNRRWPHKHIGPSSWSPSIRCNRCNSSSSSILVKSSSLIIYLLSILILLLLPCILVCVNCDITIQPPTLTVVDADYNSDSNSNSNSNNNNSRTNTYPLMATHETHLNTRYSTVNQFNADRPSASTTAYLNADPVAVALATKLERWFNAAILSNGVASNRTNGATNASDNGEESNMGNQATGQPPPPQTPLLLQSTSSPISNYANDNVYNNNYKNNNINTTTTTTRTSKIISNGDNRNDDTDQVTATSASSDAIHTTTLYNYQQPKSGIQSTVPSTKEPQFIDLEDINIRQVDPIVIEQLKGELSRLEINPYDDQNQLKEWTWCISQIIDHHHNLHRRDKDNNKRIIAGTSQYDMSIPSSSSTTSRSNHQLRQARRSLDDNNNNITINKQQNHVNERKRQATSSSFSNSITSDKINNYNDNSINQSYPPALMSASQTHLLYSDSDNTGNNVYDNDYSSNTFSNYANHSRGVLESKLSCPITFDGWRCWPTTLAGDIAYTECPSFIPGFLAERKAHKICMEDGTWFKHPSTNRTWSNYTTCVDTADLEFRQKINNLYVIGNSISVLALSISLVIFFSFKSLYCTRVTIHKNLFISFIINNLMWIVWYTYVVRSPDLLVANPFGCQLWHILLHYFLISNYFWMFCEGLYLHTLLVVAFVSEEEILKWFYLLGWAIPVPITIAYAYNRAQHQEFTQYCWMEESPYNLILMAPIGISLLLNLVFLINIVRVLVTKLRAVNSPDTHQTRKAVRATLILIPLLGLHYMLTPFRPEPKSHWEVIYESMAAICTSFQGLCVAMLFCFCNGEVIQVIRKKWLQTSFDPFVNRHSCHFTSLNAVVTTNCNSKKLNTTNSNSNNGNKIKQDSKDSSATTSFSAGSGPS